MSGLTQSSTNCGIDFANHQDQPIPGLVNAGQGYFGITDWKFDGKLDSPPQGSSAWTDDSGLVAFNLGAGLGQGGTFSIGASTWDAIGEMMFVFKGPATAGPTNSGLVAYIIGSGATSGSFATPFLEPPFSFPGAATSRDLSHISVYFTDQPVPVPTPAVAGMLALGLLGMGLVAGRRRLS
ncbi:MAG: hypothetical protein JJT88_19165 [Gammaproteobacteria bacterium]|nr:hypothetical protein [Gammaproteobacteria bacterium]